MNNENFFSRFTPKGQMRNSPEGTTVIAPINGGLRLIPNFVSIQPSFKGKFDAQIDRIWARVKADYFGKSSDVRLFKMGTIFDSLCSSDIFVVSMVVKDKDGRIDDKALVSALEKLSAFAKSEKASLHISPHLVEEVPPLRELLEKYCIPNGVNCYMYSA